jgi:hypothetical protein
MLTACSTFSSFDPAPLDDVPFRERAMTQTHAGVTVTTAVPSRDESREIFGVELDKMQIQPVWFELKNESDVPYGFLLTGIDPNYFSAHEAAYGSHLRWRRGTNRKIDIHFDDLHLDTRLMPGDHRKGFVFTNLKLGTKEIRVQLFGPGRVTEFEFYASVPGFRADYHEVDWDSLMAREFTHFDDEESFRAALGELPCCTTKKNGNGEGDPLNLIIIGDPNTLSGALIHAGWDETETLTAGSAWRTFKAFFGGEYKYSPMSSLYYDGRAQDAGFQKARGTIHQRNHLRLWLSDVKFMGEHVWVGTITRDIGVYFTLRTWNLTTHAIDPYVDEARESVVEDFAHARSLERFGYSRGIEAATREEPHRNLMNAPWWTDGLRVVVEISKSKVPIQDIEFFYWDWDVGANNEGLNEMLRERQGGGG